MPPWDPESRRATSAGTAAMPMTEPSPPTAHAAAEPAVAPSRVERVFELGAGADALYRAGLFAQSYRLALEQLREIAGDTESRSGASPSNGSAVSPPQAGEEPAIAANLRALQSLGIPADDAACTARHRRALRHAINAGAHWLRARGGATTVSRIPPAVLGVVLALLCLVAAGAMLLPRALNVRASSRYAPEFEATNVVDTSLSSEWLLPDGQPGWIEVGFRSARPIRTIRIVNCINRHYRDRATRAFRLDVFRGDVRINSFKGEFPPVGGERNLSFDVTAQSADRLLIHVDSWHGLGAGIAEIQID